MDHVQTTKKKMATLARALKIHCERLKETEIFLEKNSFCFRKLFSQIFFFCFCLSFSLIFSYPRFITKSRYFISWIIVFIPQIKHTWIFSCYKFLVLFPEVNPLREIKIKMQSGCIVTFITLIRRENNFSSRNRGQTSLFRNKFVRESDGTTNQLLSVD